MLKAEEVPRADDGPALLKLMMKFSAHGMEAGFVWEENECTGPQWAQDCTEQLSEGDASSLESSNPLAVAYLR